MAKAAFNKKKNHFTSKLDLNLRKKLVKCYVWIIAAYGPETWTLRATDTYSAAAHFPYFKQEGTIYLIHISVKNLMPAEYIIQSITH